MCQLLGMNCATPTDVTFSFRGFSQRAGITSDHCDGFGIAFFEDKACRLFVDNQSCLGWVALHWSESTPKDKLREIRSY